MANNSTRFLVSFPQSIIQMKPTDKAPIGLASLLSIVLNNTESCISTSEHATINSRGYQLEMLEESLKRNTIVTMDTGSGKTHVAVLRIKRELEIMPAGKRIWFLTPTVALCMQQCGVLQSQISSVQIKSFTSADNVDRWKQAHWDAVLTNVKIVVSTYGVLHEALCRAFVNLGSLALIVFDEVLAHNCVGLSPASKIMQDFYWPRKRDAQGVPSILGLTASPIFGSNLRSFESLELLLNATCKSPLTQKRELLSSVNRPVLTWLSFEGSLLVIDPLKRTCTMASLLAVYKSLDIHDDPEIIRLRAKATESSKNKLERALKKNKTFIQDQLRSFCRRSDEIYRTLGDWAADLYISLLISSFIQSVDLKDSKFLEWEASEKRYLANALQCIYINPRATSTLPEEKSISDKVRTLIHFLHSCKQETIGIIFVKERATVFMLKHLLSDYPDICDRFRLGSYIGTSKRPPGKRDISDFSHAENQSKTLAKFRAGKIDLLIATSVLEEGLDVPQCNLVICFDEPSNLKSFVQCRGRARLQQSRLVILLDKKSKSRIAEFEGLEREMKLRYEEEDRNSQTLAGYEENESQTCQRRQFKVPSTGALLDMENAKGYLDLFCCRLSSHFYAQRRPEYIILEDNQQIDRHYPHPLISAKVILPTTLDPGLRIRKSKKVWHSEKNATKDAAFEAYVALYHAGLVDDHLGPLSFQKPSEKQDSIVEVQEQFNPWPEVARAWDGQARLQRRVLTLKDGYGMTKCKVDMFIPVDTPDLKPLLIYWDASAEWKVEMGPSTKVQHSTLTADHTATLLSLAYGHRWEVEEARHVVVFRIGDLEISQPGLKNLPVTPKDRMDNSVILLRDLNNRGEPYLLQSWLATKPPIHLIQNPHNDYEIFPTDQPFVALKRWTRRSDFLHRHVSDPGIERQPTGIYFNVLPQSSLAMDSLPIHFSEFGLLIPSVLHKIELQLIVKELCSTVLSCVKISDTELIRTALSTPGAQEEDNYRKLEFMGDSVLKFLVSVFTAAKYLKWPEGFLSNKKDSIVSNSRLCSAAIACGLDKFVLTEIFTGSKWRPLYVDKVLEHRDKLTRKMPSKTLADVVEALIGAGWKMDGYLMSLSIAKVFLPEVDLPSLEVGRVRLFNGAPADISLSPNLHHLEELAGYSFRKKSLLVQSVSHISDTTATSSYERLKFLGDAILETIIVTELSGYDSELSHSLMHLYKTAMVNRSYLGFIALEWNVSQKRKDLKEDLISGHMTEVESQFSLPLWRFMRHGSSEIGDQQHEVEVRHASLRNDIQQAIESGTHYPWSLLATLYANKFYSDMVESLLGAVWVDSGSMHTCKQVVDRMGILRHMHRLVRDRVHCLHPREELCILANDKEVSYNLEVHTMDDGGDELRCNVTVGESQVIEVAGGLNEDALKTKAAEAAVFLLRIPNRFPGLD